MYPQGTPSIGVLQPAGVVDSSVGWGQNGQVPFGRKRGADYNSAVLARVDRVVKTASSKRISPGELADLEAFVEDAVETCDGSIAQSPSAEQSLRLIRDYRAGRAELLSIITVHELLEVMGRWRIENEGRDPVARAAGARP